MRRAPRVEWYGEGGGRSWAAALMDTVGAVINGLVQWWRWLGMLWCVPLLLPIYWATLALMSPLFVYMAVRKRSSDVFRGIPWWPVTRQFVRERLLPPRTHVTRTLLRFITHRW